MTRRRTFAAIAIVSVILITAGLGAYQGTSPHVVDDPCVEDLGDMFEMCAESRFECGEVTDEYADACQAGCMLGVCPEQVSCTELDPIWCAPCTDMYGATYWWTLRRAGGRCRHKLHFPHVDIDPNVYQECYITEVEQLCPELAGTDWLAKSQAATGVPAL